MTDTPSYQQVHNRLRLERGRASEHTCAECGNPANEWAFQHTEAALRDPATGWQYSEDPDDYAPMCRSCHRTLDLSHNPARAEKLSRGGKNWAEAYWDRHSRDADLRERHAAGARAAREALAKKRREDPEFRERHSAALRINVVAASEVFAKKYREDPEFRERHTAAVRKARAKCLECGMVSSPGGIGMHQKHTHHEGVEKA